MDNKDFGVIAGKLRSNAYDPKELLWASRLEGDRPIDDLTAGQLLQLEEIATGPWLGAKRLRVFLYPEDLVERVDEADPAVGSKAPFDQRGEPDVCEPARPRRPC